MKHKNHKIDDHSFATKGNEVSVCNIHHNKPVLTKLVKKSNSQMVVDSCFTNVELLTSTLKA